jgi:hypothetical protein
MNEKLSEIRYQYRRGIFLHDTDEELPKYLLPIEDFNGNEGYTVADYCESPFAGFHPELIRMVTRDDDYYLSLRANHFVLIFGRSEALPDWDDCVVCLANHKGGLCITVFSFLDDGGKSVCET